MQGPLLFTQGRAFHLNEGGACLALKKPTALGLRSVRINPDFPVC